MASPQRSQATVDAIVRRSMMEGFATYRQDKKTPPREIILGGVVPVLYFYTAVRMVQPYR